MRRSTPTVLLLALVLGIGLSACSKKSSSRTKGRQQPKNGRMPCPLKDCKAPVESAEFSA